MAGIQFVPVCHSRFVGSPAQAHFSPVGKGGKIYYPQFPVAEFHPDIFKFFQAYADIVGRVDQLVAGVFNLPDPPGGLQGLDSLVYFYQPIVMAHYVSDYASDEHQRAVGLFQREKVSYSPLGSGVPADVV